MTDEIIQLLEALKFSPENIPLRIHIARLYLNQGAYTDAAEQLEEVISRDPENKDATFKLAQACYHLTSYSKAIVILDGLIESGFDNKEVLLLYAKVLFKENSIAQATEYYQRVLEMDPSCNDEELDQHLRVTLQAPTYAEGDEEEFASEADTSFLEKPKINFSDVGGMKQVKQEIDLKIIKPLLHQDLYAAYGKKTGGGILLYGPPGCGKTHIAKATAGEIEANFINVGISDVLDMWMGNSEKKLHEIFEIARTNTPCVLFFDEIDAIGASRSDMRQSAGRHLINQFLAELDGIESDNDGLLVIGATNTPWHLDQAFRRPGRFDRIVFVTPPDEESRKAILSILLKGKPTSNIDLNKISSKTKDFSGADLKAIVDITIEKKLEESFTTGVPAPLTTKDLLAGIKKHKPSTKEWFNSAKNFAIYSNESGLYDDVLQYLNIKK